MVEKVGVRTKNGEPSTYACVCVHVMCVNACTRCAHAGAYVHAVRSCLHMHLHAHLACAHGACAAIQSLLSR